MMMTTTTDGYVIDIMKESKRTERVQSRTGHTHIHSVTIEWTRLLCVCGKEGYVEMNGLLPNELGFDDERWVKWLPFSSFSMKTQCKNAAMWDKINRKMWFERHTKEEFPTTIGINNVHCMNERTKESATKSGWERVKVLGRWKGREREDMRKRNLNRFSEK